MGKESEKEYIIHIHKLNHFAVHLKLTQHCKSTILQFKKKVNCIKDTISTPQAAVTKQQLMHTKL